MRVDETIAAHLNSVVGALTLGTDLFSGPPKNGNALRVFVWDDGGPPARALLSDRARRFPRVSVQVIAPANNYKAGADLKEVVFLALHQQDISTYVDVRTQEPVYIGENESGQHEWTMPTQITALSYVF